MTPRVHEIGLIQWFNWLTSRHQCTLSSGKLLMENR